MPGETHAQMRRRVHEANSLGRRASASQRIRERAGLFLATDYGARPDEDFDSAPGFQAAIDAAAKWRRAG